MLVKEVVDTLYEMEEKRPANPEWWSSYGNEAISLAVMIIRKYQELTSTDDWEEVKKSFLSEETVARIKKMAERKRQMEESR